MKDKISVIVPVYNVEKYIGKCLDSLVNQTYKNLEIVVVNDCTPDNSESIIKEYCAKYKNIVYVKNEKNSGLSYSRNNGLKHSTGDYIGYIDSDDYVPENYFECLMNTIKKEKADIAVCDINIVYENNGTSMRQATGTNKNIKLDFVANGLAASACNKLFKRENISEYQFEEGKVNEDIAVVIPTMIHAKKVAYNDETYYNYIQRDNSIQNSSISDKRFDIFYGVEQTLNRIKNCKDYDRIKDAIVYEQLIMLFIYVLPKEPKFSRRIHLLKKYNELAKKYEIRKNKFLWRFLDGQGKKHRIYYKTLLKLNCNGLSISTSFLISLYRLFREKLVKSVIEDNLSIDSLVELAKKQSKMKKTISLSVAIPNYNYEKFLIQRLYSILYQGIKYDEIIILDDCSKDNSRKLIDEIIDKLSPYISIRKVYNEENSGSAFKQWKKGVELANSEYVWIAEADDYCDKRMIKSLIKPIKNNSNIIISFCDTAFIDATGVITYKSIVPEIDTMKTGHFDHSYVNNGKDEYNNYTFVNNTIANVSSCIIKKDDYSKEFKAAGTYKQCGDWLFYVGLMQKGDIAYCSNTYNYYRVHGNNVSSVTKKKDHMKEMKRIHEYFEKHYGLNKNQKKQIEKHYKFLKKVWNIK